MNMTQAPTIKILIVEDNLADAELIRQKLASVSDDEFQLVVSKSMADASHKLDSDAYDVVLLDLGLPDSAGIDTLVTFLADQSGLPVVVLTGSNDEDMAVEAVNHGAQDFLVKDGLDAKLLRRSIRYCMERHRLEQEKHRLSAQLLQVVGDEQQRIARELHDEVGQTLAGLNMMTRSLARKLREQGVPEAKKTQMISEGIQDVLDSFRQVLCGLSPVDLDARGLPVALRRLCESIQQAGVECTFSCDSEFSIEYNSIATHLYRIAQESLTNAMRHSSAKHLHVTLERNRNRVALAVCDDGDGFDPDEVTPGGMGMRILRHRSELIGGSLTISSGRMGTAVRIEVGLDGSKTDQ